MKTILYYILILSITFGCFFSCKKMDSTYKEFIVQGGITYTGKTKSAKAFAGHNRVKISWLRGADPTVTKAKVFWDHYLDSIEVDIPTTGDTISVIIENLEEKPYTFIVKTYDSKGNSSVPVELLSAAYGDKYQAGILSRPLRSAKLNDLGSATLQWGPANISGGAYGMDIKYTDEFDQVKIEQFPINESTSVFEGVKSGTTFQYRTRYLPDSLSIDTFYTPFIENKDYLFDKSNWKVIDFSTQHAGAENLVTNIIDGSPETRWHTISNVSSKYPHFVTVDMISEKTVTSFEIFRMKDDVRACDRFQLLVSIDNIAWVDLGIFNFNRLINDGQIYEIPSHPRARYFKFVGLAGPNPFMVTGEINVYGL